MIGLRLEAPHADVATGLHRYRIAGHCLDTNARLAELTHYAADLPGIGLAMYGDREESGEPVVIYNGPGWVANQWRNVACWRTPATYRMAVAGAGFFRISADGNTIDHASGDAEVEPSVVVEAALGPALILALALQGTWTLHASAVLVGDRAVAFVGESGAGKSTLAQYLSQEGYTRWRRLADDVLPVVPVESALDILPHFPQLKLAPDECSPATLPERAPLIAIYVLAPADACYKTVQIRRLGKRDAALGVVRHTIAARLFDGALLARHLAFCAYVAAHVRICRLTYPRRYELLPAVHDAIRADLHVR